MRLKIIIDMDNAAFEDDPGELARILETIPLKIEQQKEKLFDINGNTVGRIKICEGPIGDR